MRILGIDPGLASVGWGLIVHPEGGPGDVRFGEIKTRAGRSMASRLLLIHDALRDLIADLRPEAVSIEELFFATNVKTAIVVAQARGAAILATAESGVAVAEYTPLQIKKAVSGRGGASKQQVQKMVAVLLGLKEVPHPDHAADALAAALCHAHTLKTSRLIELAGGGKK
jgi:crossover junction endodeoxyribonuclease RuvC